MIAVLLLAQLSARPAISMADSAALHGRAEKVEFQFLMDWRYVWQKHMEEFVKIDRRAKQMEAPPHFNPGIALRRPVGIGCAWESTARYDLDPHEWMAHLIKAPNRVRLSLCPAWSRPNWYEPPDERTSVDASFNQEGFPPAAADTVRLMRKKTLAVLDSIGSVISGDSWLLGQRVRLHVDQAQTGTARKLVKACGAEPWWCLALEGFIDFSDGEVTRASATFDRARPLMPDSVRCDWDDASLFFSNTGRVTYSALTCAQRDSVNERVWWLADPLFIENGNERRTEHYARHVLVELHAALDADERFDWRVNYQGPALREMVLRYGWPTQITTWDSLPMRWHAGNTRSMFLGDTTITIAGMPFGRGTWCDGVAAWSFGDWYTGKRGNASTELGTFHCGEPSRLQEMAAQSPSDTMVYSPKCHDGDIIGKSPLAQDFYCNPYIILPGIKYWGPQFHTVPLWQTVLDPFHASDQGWDLAPPRDGGPYFDTSWWPTEFYRRNGGPLVPLSTQVAFFRRERSAIVAAAMSWDTIAYIAYPLERMTGAVMLSTGPRAPLVGIRDTMSGRAPRPLVSTVPSGQALLGVEMVPRDASGPAARTRFGVTVPRPLGELAAPDLALSDVVLTSAPGSEAAPATFVAMLPRMLGSTLLRDPKRIALFWELYGLATGDTIDVTLRVTRRDDDTLVQQFAALFGFGSNRRDSLSTRWTEPRPDEPTATLSGGVSIRPRGLTIDIEHLSPGRYDLEIVAQRRGGRPVTTVRSFRIVRR